MGTKTLFLLIVSAAALTGAAADESLPERHDGAYLHQISTAVETPHVKWLKPSAGPTPKVLFMVARVWGASTQIRPRDIVEIWQRMDLEYTEFVYMQSASERDRWESNIAGSRTEEKWAEATEKLAADYDAIVLIDFDPGTMPAELQKLLHDKVKAGCGLVLANRSNCPWPLEAIPDSTRFMRGVPLTQIASYVAQTQALKGELPTWEQVASKVGAAYQLGKGRVARIRPGNYGVNPEDEVHLEYGCSLYIRALQWVIPDLAPAFSWQKLPQGDQTPRYIQTLKRFIPGLGPAFNWRELPEGVEIPRARLPLQALNLSVHSTRPQAQHIHLDIAVRNHLNEVEYESSSEAILEPGDNTIAYTLPLLSAGRHFLDLWLRSTEGIKQYGSIGLRVQAPVSIDSIEFDTPFHRLGDDHA